VLCLTGSIQYHTSACGNRIILLFWVLDIFAIFWRVLPPAGGSNTGAMCKLCDFLSNRPCSGRLSHIAACHQSPPPFPMNFMLVAVAAYVWEPPWARSGGCYSRVSHVSSPWKTIPHWNLCFQQRLPPPVYNMSPSVKNLSRKCAAVTVCVLLMHDLFAIAKFLVHTDSYCITVNTLDRESVVYWSIVIAGQSMLLLLSSNT